ncbi:MAG TPA: insulinase family protein [Candidatus Cloacimonetes bacterium]|nr:insulinase family protein [Candidatus Cloacimonadota bacterium]HEX37789.1 insulinase family protein [Candidatus Cloacimonadota bacterium]
MSYKKTVLDNGITVLSEHIEHVRSISVGVWINAGSRDETPPNLGIAHFLEHMLFKGTKNRSKIDIAFFLEYLGGAVNAYTSKEYTCIYARCLEEHLQQSIDLISDLLLHSTFPDEELEKEKEVVIDEINDIKDSPGDLLFDKFYEDIFPKHSLGHPISGFEENVLNFKREICTEFITQNYIPDRIVITASGYIDHKKLVQYVEQFFTFKKDIITTKRVLNPPQPIKEFEKIYSTEKNQQTHFCIGTRTFSYTDSDRYKLLALNAILSGGMSSRLFQNIREEYGISYDIGSFTDFFHDAGCMGIYAATNPKNSDMCIDLIHKEVDKLVHEKVDETELQRTKALLKSSILIGLESTSARMNRLAKQYIYLKEVYPIDKVIKNIEKITPEDLQELAIRLFDGVDYVTTILRSTNGN